MARIAAIALLLGASGCGQASFGATASETGVLPQSSTIQGRDGAQSGLAWGHSVWTFGDTVLNQPDAQGSTWHHNSFSITDDLDASDGIGGFTERLDTAGAPRYLLAPTTDEASFNAAHLGDSCAEKPCGARFAVWPGAPIWDEPRHRGIIFYALIYAEPGAYNFHGVGQSVALWNDFASDPERPEVAPGSDHPTLMFGEGEPSWGTTALIDDGLLYIFACDGDPLGPPCRLARTDPATVIDRSTWRFWDGQTWVSAPSDHAVFNGAPTVGVGFNQHLGRYAAIYAEPLSNKVVIRTASSLTGPWSDASLLFEAKNDSGSSYDANWHKEYDDGATLYVTWSRSTQMGGFGSEFALERVVLP